ncbi:hypothetical protein J1614_012223 [Plenodomus biglobosus]|nr:hypothetical protein J1614_012223 [Plenodomus biglobosus]
MVSVFYEILRRGLKQPQTPIVTMPLIDGLADLRSKGLLEVEKTDYLRESSVVDDAIHEQVAASPDAIAVTGTNSQRTYSELNQQSNKPAIWLRQRYAGIDAILSAVTGDYKNGFDETVCVNEMVS